MRIGDIIGFREDLFFDGAVQIDWFYNQAKANRVASSFVFHGKEYFGISDELTGNQMTDTISFFRAVANKIEDEQRGNPFTLAIAEYGTGKSHLAVTLAQLLSGKGYMPNTYNKIIDNIRRIDNEASKQIESVCDKPNLVLAINGMRDFNLHYEILKAASRSLRLYGYSDDNLKKLNRAHETAFRFFERNIETSILRFEKKARDFGWVEQGKSLADKLRRTMSEDNTAFKIINGVYEEINGHEIRWDEGVSANLVLETLLREYCGISGEFNKIVIIFDEFGRYLEYASSADSAQSGDSALQQIFESIQNSDGNIQMINFIQSDIKVYLQRVDKTRNISRYIGRYDASEKFHLSSNLETVFANLIDRKNKDAFSIYIKGWLNKNEQELAVLYSNMDKWLPLKGLWKDKMLFSQVIVEGIYPLHPISTYMLTGLSGYLQNRSSLTLVNNHITVLSNYEISPGQACPLVLPEQLLDGDLYFELLSAEQEGRQLSRHCIRYDNILRKLGDKLSNNMKKVLRSNLILKLLRFRTSDYEDAILALSTCSGVSISSIKQELIWLENEYAVLGFDEHTSSFDFLEDSSGAHDFRTFYRRIKSGQTLSSSIFDNSNVRELSGILTPIYTNFPIEKKIKSNEWQFNQDLFHITELSEAYIDSLILDFMSSTTPEKIKGKLIWLYINRDTEDKVLDYAKSLSEKLIGMPIVMFLLNDAENKLHASLLEYEVLTTSISTEEKNRFGRHYTDALLQAENNLKDAFSMLQRERLMVCPNTIKSLTNRLTVSLTDILNDTYPEIVPFDFDGFDSKQPGRARKSYCSILKLLLSGSINANTIQSSPVEVRNRFEATLFESGINSWKCINIDYQIIPPKNQQVFAIYSYLERELKEKKSLNCMEILTKLRLPPYGLNDYIIIYLISVFCANFSYCIRAISKEKTYSIIRWKDLFIGDNRVDVEIVKATNFILVDSGAVTDSYLRLFKKVENNDNVSLVDEYSKELQQLTQSEEIPKELEAQYKLCEYRLNEGYKILSSWNRLMDDLITKYEMAIEHNDVYKALQAINALNSTSIYRVFTSGYVVSEQTRKQVGNLETKLREFVEPRLIPWIREQKCYSVEQMSQYRKHYKHIVSLLQSLNYYEEAKKAKEHGEAELESRDKIRERQELAKDCNTYISEKRISQYVPYTSLIDWEKQGTELLAKIDKYRNFLGSDYLRFHNNITTRLNEIIDSHQKIKSKMNDIWNDIYELTDIDAVESMIERIDIICKKGIPSSDRNDFIELQKVLEAFIIDTKELKRLCLDREGFKKQYRKLYEKYARDDVEIDVLHILESLYDQANVMMNTKEDEWINKYIISISEDISRAKALEWIDKTINLPLYLSDETKLKHSQTKKIVSRILSDANIGDVIFHFRKLNRQEQVECIEKLISIIENEK